jgi:hypothetical protein
MYSARERERRRILTHGCEKLSHGLGVFEQEVDKCRRLFYDLQASWEMKVQRQKNERRRRVVIVIIQNHIRMWLVWRAYLKFLWVTSSIQCCWRKVLAIREFWRLKQEANKVATDPIQDSRANLLEEGGNDMVSIVSHSYQTYFGFSGLDLNLDCGLRDHEVRITSTIKNRKPLPDEYWFAKEKYKDDATKPVVLR